MSRQSVSRIVTFSVEPVVERNLTEPIEEELTRLYGVPVNTNSSEWEPPAAGMAEIALMILAVGPIAVAGARVVGPSIQDFFRPLATAAGEEFRDYVLRVLREGRKSKTSGRRYIPVVIELGEEKGDEIPITPVRYYFHGEIDEQELIKRLEAADEHVRSLPSGLLSGIGGPQEHGFFWDEEQSKWRGSVARFPDPLYGETGCLLTY